MWVTPPFQLPRRRAQQSSDGKRRSTGATTVWAQSADEKTNMWKCKICIQDASTSGGALLQAVSFVLKNDLFLSFWAIRLTGVIGTAWTDGTVPKALSHDRKVSSWAEGKLTLFCFSGRKLFSQTQALPWQTSSGFAWFEFGSYVILISALQGLPLGYIHRHLTCGNDEKPNGKNL